MLINNVQVGESGNYFQRVISTSQKCGGEIYSISLGFLLITFVEMTSTLLSLVICLKIYIVLIQKNKNLIIMELLKSDLEKIIDRAKSALGNNDEGVSSYDLIEKYIKDAENILPDIDGELTSQQKEVYDNLEAAVGP
jgi:hypothetical protein